MEYVSLPPLVGCRVRYRPCDLFLFRVSVRIHVAVHLTSPLLYFAIGFERHLDFFGKDRF